MTEEDFDKITIETANAIKTQFAILHFGIYFFFSFKYFVGLYND